jgi:hypothetical protein
MNRNDNHFIQYLENAQKAFVEIAFVNGPARAIAIPGHLMNQATT